MKGELVELRRVTEDDYDALASWASGLPGLYGSGSAAFPGREDMRRSIESGGARYLIAVDPGGTRIGAVTWDPGAHALSFRIGVMIGDEELWTEGHGAEAVLLLLNLLFHTMGAHRVEMITGLYNRQPVRMVTQGYMVLEGILRDYFFVDGDYYDAVILSLLRPDYYRLVNDLEIPQDVIPADQKREARETLRKHLADISADYFVRLIER
ncbi:GNAT family N-acetyltransferase [Actinomadura algeriensis]|uniref:RimJ/RimL family protein N-acetyltransferase n=1 Tax=Actinomadura algeriensis TaxID=1679523 RepID=A0ABR9JIP2_9ACTN|nr:GNAT family protein [Actinomadura algeriensis]MBE1530420.1 RimJ/RimL family protein N-acetyltransferase [Actinomadura algeriensis]